MGTIVSGGLPGQEHREVLLHKAGSSVERYSEAGDEAKNFRATW